MLILISALVGQLFVAGYFFDASDTTPIYADTSTFVTKAIVVSISSTLLMIPLKVIISQFLAGHEITEKATRKELDDADKRTPKLRTIGYICVSAWFIGCGYAIIMFAINFTTIALQKWLICFFGSFGYDVILMFNIKVLTKVAVAVILMMLVRSPLMLTLAGAISGKLVDWMMIILSGPV